MRGEVRRQLRRVDHDLGILGHFIGVVDSCESLDFARTRHRVEPFAVALLADLERRRDMRLEEAADRYLSYYLSEIVPVALSAHVSRQLGVRRGTPAISFQEVGFDQDNRPIVRATSFFRDDLLRFRLIRRKSGA